MSKSLYESIDNLDSFVLKEDELSQNELEDLASYMYEDIIGDYDIDNISSYEDNDYVNCSKSDYKKAIKMIEKAIDNIGYGDKIYNDYIEINDNHTLWDVNVEDDISDVVSEEHAMQLWNDLVTKALEDLEEYTLGEVYQDGRSGRHIVMKNNFYNAYHYPEIREKQEELEQRVIKEYEDKLNELARG